jgi:hypothetical protein
MAGSALDDLATALAPSLEGTDVAAVHVDEAGEITAVDAKAEPAIDDVVLIEDAADGDAKKSVTIGAMLRAAGQLTNLDAATPLIGDKVAFEDQSDSDAMKVATVQEILAAPGWMSGVSAATPLAADVVVFEDASDSLAIKRTTVGALPIAQAQVVGLLLEPAADAAVTLLGTTRAVNLTVTGAATIVIANGAGLYAGQTVNFRAVAVAGGGSYTLAVQGGTLTIDATDEEPEVIRNQANDAWVVIRKSTATIV